MSGREAGSGAAASTPATAAAAERLLAAARHSVPCAPIRDLIGPDDIDAAYAVQRLVHALGGEDRRRSGWKIGLTSEAVQRQLGVGRPDFGVLFADMDHASDRPVAPGRLLQPKIEAEVAFVLGADLVGPITAEQVRRSISYAVAALEIVDSRVAGWDITIVDTVADNASCGLYVLGDVPVSLDDVDLPGIVMEMTKDGHVVSTGTGAACLGDPLLAATWLATTTANYGEQLRAGDVILSGALGPMVEVTPGSSFVARLAGLGDVTVSFAQGAPDA